MLFVRCDYNYQIFLSSVNASAIKKPMWAESLTLMIDFMDSKKSGDNNIVVKPDHEETEDESLAKVYNVFLGSSMGSGSGQGLDLDTSFILTYYDLEDWHMYRGLLALVGFMIGLKFLTYYVLLAKLRSTK